MQATIWIHVLADIVRNTFRYSESKRSPDPFALAKIDGAGAGERQ